MDEGDRGRLDAVNRPTWVDVAAQYAVEGWSDPGEAAAVAFIADGVRGDPVLDLGVGGGRTVALLRDLTDDYLGIDYTPELVELCRARHPGVTVELGDARDLSGLAEHSRGLVVFSSNGIDSVDHDGRQLVLSGVHRVLRPGGTFLFSTLNKDHQLFGAHPGTAPPGLPSLENAPRDEETWIRAVKNWRRLRGEVVDEGEWGIAPFAAHEFRLLAHFITLRGAVDELERHGFEVAAVFPCDSSRAQSIDEPVDAMYMHFVARARARP